MKRHFSKQSLLRTMMIVATLLFMMPAQNAWADNVATATVDGNTYTYSSLEAAVSAANGAQSTATVTLLKDITEQPCSLEVRKPMIIDLNGHTVNADNLPYAYGVFSILNNSGQVVIKNGTISRMGASGNFVYAIYNYCNDLILENVTVKNTYSAANPCLYNNGMLTISKGITLVGSIKNSGTVQIASGQELYDKNGIEYSGYINSRVANLANNTLSSLVTVTANGITNTYNSLQDAVSAAANAYTTYGTAATITLNHDITEQPCSLEVGKPMIIDLNGHVVNADNLTYAYGIFSIMNAEGQVIIKNGTISRRGENDYNGFAIYNYNSNVELENVTVKNTYSTDNPCLYNNNGTLTISKNITLVGSIKNSGTVQIASGQKLYDKNGIEYSGYINSRVANLANNTLSYLVTVTANGTTTPYNSLQDAVSAAANAYTTYGTAATITLNHDITEQPCSLEVTKPMIIDLNGHVVNANNLNYGYGIFSIMNAEGQVIIKNGTISRRGVNDYNGFAIYNYKSNVELENVTVKNTYSTDNPCLYNNNGTLTISKNITLVGSIKNSGTVQIASGQLLGDASGKYYLGTLTSAQVVALSNNTLSSLSVVASGSCGTDVKWALTGTSPNYTLTISGTGTISTNPWYNYRADITSVVINNGVTGINMAVFMNTPNLTSVTIPASVTSIGQQAFDGCTNLETVSGCEGVTDVGNDAFSGTKWLTDQPDGVVYIGKVAYLGKNVSGEVNIKAGTVSISSNAFQDCTSLTSVTIPSSVESIGDYAFRYCTYLASVTIPVASLTYYGVSAFDNTADGLKIYVPGSALSAYKETNWRDYKDNFVGLYTVAFGTLPDGVSGVAPSMAAEGETVTISFSGVPDGKVPVVSVTYGDNNDNVNDIIDNGDGTFSFVMPNGNATVTASDLIEKIPYIDADGNTAYCTNYTVLDNTMTTISAGWYVVNSDVTFNGDLSTDVSSLVDNTVNIILCDGATLTANKITPIRNRDNLRIYGQSQSTGTANISGSIVASSSLQIYGGTIVTGYIMCPQSGVGIYGGNVTAADIDGHEGSLSLKGGTITASSLTVDQGDIELGGATVTAGSYNVTQGNVTILTGITYYDGTGASYTAGNLTSSQISDIEGKTLRTYDYRGGTCGKDDSATGDVDESLNVTWVLTGDNPYTLTISGTGAMQDYGAPDDQPWKDYRSTITSVVIENGVTSIGNMAFEGCNNANLTSVTIPASVERIGDYAFAYCTYLASVTIPVASLTYYGVSAFDDTAAGLKIYVPGSALSTYKAATNWSDYKDNFVGVYTLTYDLAGGTLPAGKSNPESYTAEDKNFLLNNPTKEGYAFAGWKYDYTEGNNTSNHTEVFVEVVPFWEQDLSFTATWVAEDESHKDLAKCRAEVDNPLYRGGSGNYVGYYYDGGYGIKVYDGETLLTYGTDYSYSMLVSLDGGSCDDMGEHCRVLLTGEGNYVGGLSADVVIVANSVNGKWGDLKWAYDNGTLTISRKDGVTEDVVMDPMSSTGEGYDSWLGIGSGIFSIVFEEGVKTIAETAFGYVGDGLHHYSNLATISLPSSLTEIGANAFAHCDGLTVDLDDILAKNITLGNNAFYQIGCLAGSLANMANNATKIALLYQAARANVTLSDRTLYKDGNWNTLCLPFALGNAMADEGHHFDGTPLEGATVMELKVADSEFDAASGTLSLFFTDAKSISAGTPYIVKWEGDGTNNLVNPLFTGVKVFTDAPTPVQSHDEKVQFRGIYSSTNIYSADHDNLFLGIGKNNQNEDVSMLFWPNTTDYTLGAFRAYFHVDLTETNGVRDIVLNFEDGTQTTGIIGHTDNTDNTDKADAAWYTIDGRKLDGKPTSKGLYVHGGRKVVIK